MIHHSFNNFDELLTSFNAQARDKMTFGKKILLPAILEAQGRSAGRCLKVCVGKVIYPDTFLLSIFKLWVTHKSVEVCNHALPSHLHSKSDFFVLSEGKMYNVFVSLTDCALIENEKLLSCYIRHSGMWISKLPMEFLSLLFDVNVCVKLIIIQFV